MTTNESTEPKPEPVTHGQAHNGEAHTDPTEAAVAEATKTPKVRARKKPAAKYQLLRVTLERIVPHQGALLIAIRASDVPDVDEALDAIDEVHGLDEFVEYHWDDLCDIPVEIADVEEIDGDPATADFAVSQRRNGNWRVTQILKHPDSTGEPESCER